MVLLQGGHVLMLLTAVNVVNFMDRGITSGAPAEFSHFVNVSLGVPMEDTLAWTGATYSSFLGFYSISSVVFGHLIQSQPAFRLLSIGLCIWVYALASSGLAYFFPRDPFAFWWYLIHRAISGVGEAAFQCIVPTYIEDIAPAGSKAMWLSIFYIAIPCGTAIGFVYGVLLAPPPPQSIGWGWAYLIEAIAMAPCAVGIAWLPRADVILRRRAARVHARGALLAPLTHSAGGGGTSTDQSLTSSPIESPESSTSVLPPGLTVPTGTAIAVSTADPVAADGGDGADGKRGARMVGEQAGREGGAPPPSGCVADALCAEHTVLYQLGWLLRTPIYLLLLLGYAAQTATVMGVSTVGTNFVVGHVTTTERSPRRTAATCC